VSWICRRIEGFSRTRLIAAVSLDDSLPPDCPFQAEKFAGGRLDPCGQQRAESPHRAAIQANLAPGDQMGGRQAGLNHGRPDAADLRGNPLFPTRSLQKRRRTRCADQDLDV
jgi:hypothetical protein